MFLQRWKAGFVSRLSRRPESARQSLVLFVVSMLLLAIGLGGWHWAGMCHGVAAALCLAPVVSLFAAMLFLHSMCTPYAVRYR